MPGVNLLGKDRGEDRFFHFFRYLTKLHLGLGNPLFFGVRISMMSANSDELISALKSRFFGDNGGPPISVDGGVWKDTQHSKYEHVGVHNYVLPP